MPSERNLYKEEYTKEEGKGKRLIIKELTSTFKLKFETHKSKEFIEQSSDFAQCFIYGENNPALQMTKNVMDFIKDIHAIQEQDDIKNKVAAKKV